VDAEVAKAPSERTPLSVRSRGEPLGDLGGRRGLPLEPLLDEVDEHAVLLPVADGIEPQHGCLFLGFEVGEADVEPRRSLPTLPNHDALRCGPVAVGQVSVDSLPKQAEANEVRVRIQDHDPEGGLEKELLEHRAKGIALPGPGLPAEERVPVEAARVEQEANARLGGKLADVEAGARGSRLPEPCRDPLVVGADDLELVEGSGSAAEEHSQAVDLAARPRLKLDRVHLAEVLADRRVAPRLQLEALHRRMEGERPAVDRRRGRH
jgi:hypothetical protein